MSKRMKIWAYTAVLTGGALLGGGCGWFPNLNGQWGWVLAWLQEDLFG